VSAGPGTPHFIPFYIRYYTFPGFRGDLSSVGMAFTCKEQLADMLLPISGAAGLGNELLSGPGAPVPRGITFLSVPFRLLRELRGLSRELEGFGVHYCLDSYSPEAGWKNTLDAIQGQLKAVGGLDTGRGELLFIQLLKDKRAQWAAAREQLPLLFGDLAPLVPGGLQRLGLKTDPETLMATLSPQLEALFMERGLKLTVVWPIRAFRPPAAPLRFPYVPFLRDTPMDADYWEVEEPLQLPRQAGDGEDESGAGLSSNQPVRVVLQKPGRPI
jgi:hypothetical protein